MNRRGGARKGTGGKGTVRPEYSSGQEGDIDTSLIQKLRRRSWELALGASSAGRGELEIPASKPDVEDERDRSIENAVISETCEPVAMRQEHLSAEVQPRSAHALKLVGDSKDRAERRMVGFQDSATAPRQADILLQQLDACTAAVHQQAAHHDDHDTSGVESEVISKTCEPLAVGEESASAKVQPPSAETRWAHFLQQVEDIDDGAEGPEENQDSTTSLRRADVLRQQLDAFTEAVDELKKFNLPEDVQKVLDSCISKTSSLRSLKRQATVCLSEMENLSDTLDSQSAATRRVVLRWEQDMQRIRSLLYEQLENSDPEKLSTPAEHRARFLPAVQHCLVKLGIMSSTVDTWKDQVELKRSESVELLSPGESIPLQSQCPRSFSTPSKKRGAWRRGYTDWWDSVEDDNSESGLSDSSDDESDKSKKGHTKQMSNGTSQTESKKIAAHNCKEEEEQSGTAHNREEHQEEEERCRAASSDPIRPSLAGELKLDDDVRAARRRSVWNRPTRSKSIFVWSGSTDRSSIAAVDPKGFRWWSDEVRGRLPFADHSNTPTSTIPNEKPELPSLTSLQGSQGKKLAGIPSAEAASNILSAAAAVEGGLKANLAPPISNEKEDALGQKDDDLAVQLVWKSHTPTSERPDSMLASAVASNGSGKNGSDALKGASDSSDSLNAPKLSWKNGSDSLNSAYDSSSKLKSSGNSSESLTQQNFRERSLNITLPTSKTQNSATDNLQSLHVPARLSNNSGNSNSDSLKTMSESDAVFKPSGRRPGQWRRPGPINTSCRKSAEDAKGEMSPLQKKLEAAILAEDSCDSSPLELLRLLDDHSEEPLPLTPKRSPKHPCSFPLEAKIDRSNQQNLAGQLRHKIQPLPKTSHASPRSPGTVKSWTLPGLVGRQKGWK